MRKIQFILLVLIFVSGCEEQHGLFPKSIEYDFQFPVELHPNSISIDEERNLIYVASQNNSKSNHISKIQRFSLDGRVQKELDFLSFNEGEYSHYYPIDLCIDVEGILYVLVQPFSKQDYEEYYTLIEKLSILQFDMNFGFQNEFEVPDNPNNKNRYTSIAYANNYLFVTGGLIINKISKDGELVSEISPSNFEENADSLSHVIVADMEVSSGGMIYLTGQGAALFDDYSGCYLSKLEPKSGSLTTTYSQSRTGVIAAWPNNPGLAIDKEGNLYLATYYGRSLEIYNSNLEFLKQVDITKYNWDEDTYPIDIALYDSWIYIPDHRNNLVQVYEASY